MVRSTNTASSVVSSGAAAICRRAKLKVDAVKFSGEPLEALRTLHTVTPAESGTRADGMAHSLQYQITESVRVVEIEIGKLFDLAAMLKDDGNDVLATTVSNQASKLLEAAVALRIAMSG